MEVDDWLKDIAGCGNSGSTGSTIICRRCRQRRTRQAEKKRGGKNSIDLDTDPRTIIGTRDFDAPAEMVFSVFTRRAPGAMVGAGRLHHHDVHFRFRRRGLAFRHAWARRPRLREPHHLRRIVPGDASSIAMAAATTSSRCNSRRTLTFEDLGNGKTRLNWHGTFPSAEVRARVIKDYGADKGLVQTMARLDEYVATLATAGRA